MGLRLLLLRLLVLLFIGSAVVDSAAVGCSVSAGSECVGLAVLLPVFSFEASLPSARELPQTLPNGAVDNRC